MPQEEEVDENNTLPNNSPANELYVRVVYHSKLYTYNTGRFSVRPRRGNQDILVAYHTSNLMLAQPFSSRKNNYRISVYETIMDKLSTNGLLVDIQIVDKEVNKDFKKINKDTCEVDYQLVPPDMHIQNAVEKTIRTFKAHFPSILAGVDT